MGNLRQKYTDEEWEELEKRAFSEDDDDDLYEIMVPDGSLILTPNQTKEDCIKQFENWLEKMFN